MDDSCLRYVLTDDELSRFDSEGFLIQEDAIDAAQIDLLTAAADRIYMGKLADGFDARKALFYPDFITDDPAFVELVDYSKVLQKSGESWAGTSTSIMPT